MEEEPEAEAYFLDFPLVSRVCARDIVSQSFWASEFMVRGRGGNNVALPCDLACKALDRTGHCSRNTSIDYLFLSL